MKRKIILAGGTGFIGVYLRNKFETLGYEVKIISRQSVDIEWRDTPAVIEALENAEMLINPCR